VISLILEGKEHIFEGIVKGSIISEKRGADGFGYDPIFVPEGQNKTFAELSMDEKNTMSHRARAFEKMIHFLKNDHLKHTI
jgi:XTP/dITP diphosphohydrolase